MRVYLSKFIYLFSFFILFYPNISYSKVKVSVSIRPLYDLVTAVGSELVEANILMDKSNSPHYYTITPQDIEKIKNSDIVFMALSESIPLIEKAIDEINLKEKNKIRLIEFISADGIELLQPRTNNLFSHFHHDHDHDHDHNLAYDPHIWLNPKNAEIIVRLIATNLSSIDPKNKHIYHANAVAFIRDLRKLDNNIKKKLSPYKFVNFVVDHDAYQYFEEYYGLSSVGSVTLADDQLPGAKTMIKLKKMMIKKDIPCFFVNPNNNSSLIKSLREDTKVRVGYLDAEWGGGTSSYYKKEYNNNYLNLMNNIANSFCECFSQELSKVNEQDTKKDIQ